MGLWGRSLTSKNILKALGVKVEFGCEKSTSMCDVANVPPNQARATTNQIFPKPSRILALLWDQ